MALNAQQQSQLATTLQSKGYNETDARNAAANAGGRAESLYREYIMGGNGGGNNNGGGGNQMVDQALQQLRQAISTTTSALTGQKSLIPQQTAIRKTEVEQQRSNLETRYADLLDEVKGQTQQALTRTEGTGKEELARRGINLQGNLGQSEINALLNPINQEGARQIKQIGTSREADIMTLNNIINRLPLEEQEQMLKIEEAIGRVQSAGSQTELDLALKMLANEQANLKAKQDYELKLAEQEMQKDYYAAQIKNIESQISERGKKTATETPTDWGSVLSGIEAELNGGQSNNKTNAYTPYEPTSAYDFGYVNPDILQYLTR